MAARPCGESSAWAGGSRGWALPGAAVADAAEGTRRALPLLNNPDQSEASSQRLQHGAGVGWSNELQDHGRQGGLFTP